MDIQLGDQMKFMAHLRIVAKIHTDFVDLCIIRRWYCNVLHIFSHDNPDEYTRTSTIM